MAEDGVLADTKLIAEPWDAVRLYQGAVPFRSALERWNGQFATTFALLARDLRLSGTMAMRIGGSPTCKGEQPPAEAFVNFLTGHDGFTLTIW